MSSQRSTETKSRAAVMAASTGRPRVLIVGGSIAGLALANMLEQTGIDYLVLEKYQVAPQLGASIALLPNSTRILDQIGCWEAVLKNVRASDAFRNMQTRDPAGKLLSSGPHFGQSVEERYGTSLFSSSARVSWRELSLTFYIDSAIYRSLLSVECSFKYFSITFKRSAMFSRTRAL